MMRIIDKVEVDEQPIQIQADGVLLDGDLAIPHAAHGVILFAHGSGSSRHSPRNRFVASELHQAGFATLLFDLLTEEEEEVDQVTAHLRFNIGFLAERLVFAADWLSQDRRARACRWACSGPALGRQQH